MAKSMKDKIKALPKGRQEAIKARADELIAEEMTLQDLRKAMQLTQVDVAQELHINQEAVSRLERRSDLLLSTLSTYIESMGGKLKLTAEFPDRPSVSLTGFDELHEGSR